ncbi:MAG: DNA repair protein RecN [Bacteroidales bacterium]|nr:DNA repair protein RecN [Bacteroidales bacterium]
MISSLVIKNYALIDNLSIELDKGLSIITGETGAGKSIILGAMSLILGNRADTSVINNSEQKCVVEAIFDITGYKLQKIFKANEIEYFEKAIVRREISPEGRSRAFVNDTPVNLSTLKEITEKLIDIHSQHDTLELNSAVFQTEVIDLIAKNTNILTDYQTTFKAFKRTTNELIDLQELAQKEKADFDYYQYQYEQLENADLKPSEEEELELEQKQLTHTEEIKTNLSKINFLLNNEENSVLDMLKEALKASENITDFLPQAKDIFSRLESASIDLQDLANEADVLDNDLELDPERLEFINNRLDTIYNLQHKFSVPSINDLLKLQNDFAEKLEQISSFDEQIEQKKAEIEQIRKKLTDLADILNKNRNSAKKTFEEKITYIVENLGMPNTKFDVQIQKTEEFTTTGTDKITFLFSANKSSEPQPITKIASGGELSRLMLAIKYLISKSKTLPTIIFDEIDTGISGEIAAKMGALLQKMSDNLQIINITHLPQIAAKAHHHFFVYKEETAEKTISHIRKLSDNERITEIAKMLSGTNITESAVQNAKELLNN